MKISRKLIIAFLPLMVFVIHICCYATSIQNWLLSGNSVGVFGAGLAASADNPDTSYYNPAGSVWITHQDAGFSLLTSVNDLGYSGQETFNGGQVQGQAQGGRVYYTPNLFYVAPISDRFAFGFSVSSPFQEDMSYGGDAVTRYQVAKWEINTVDISPSLAFRMVPHIAFGIGIDFQRASIDFDQAYSDLGNLQGLSRNDLHDWGYGWNTGVLWVPKQTTHIGLSYHSKVKHDPSGTSQIVLSNGSLNQSHVSSHYQLPPIIIISVAQKLGKRWQLLASADYTEWEKLNNLVLNNLATPTGVSDETVLTDLKNSWILALATSYRLSDSLLWKVGFGYDQKNISNEDRSLISPNVSAFVVSLGSRYALTKHLRFDCGYSHYFKEQGTINGMSQQNLATSSGTIDNSKDVFGVQFNWQMT